MRAFIVLAVFGLVFALTEASALKTKKNKGLSYSCDISAIESDVESIVAATLDLKTEIYSDVFSIYDGLLTCVKDFNLETFVSCVETAVESGISDLYTDVEYYITNVKSLAEDAVTDVQNCFLI